MAPSTTRILVRPYQSSDRAIVRRICCDTADRGASVESFFPDRELVADLVTAYYTDYEPECAWIAECDGQPVGYLTGSFDTARSRRITLWRIAPGAVVRAIGRGVLCRAQTWRFLRAALPTLRHRPAVSSKRFPAHVHVNVQAEFRGRQIGDQLLACFLERMNAAGLKGVHANVRSDNAGGRRFFERKGFAPLNADEGTATVVYGKRL